MKVLHVNVRLQEGGAARIALDLHRQLLNAGIESRFAYGWGERGGVSSAESNVPYCIQVGRPLQVASNMVLHRVAGIDRVAPVGKGRKQLIQSIQWADVVHLHVIHSYFLPLGWIVKKLVHERKPVVWTAHDYWMLTGRCASTERCERWRDGCGSCPTQKNYPPAYLDFSGYEFITKRHLVASLGRMLQVVAPSKIMAHAIIDAFPDVEARIIPNWIDREYETAIKYLPCSDAPILWDKEKVRILIIANDLSDPTKVDRELINKLLEMSHIVIHTVGSHSPFSGSRVVNHGRVESRKILAEIITSITAMLFTSEKDTFGLVLIEALAAGTPVLAIESAASREVLSSLGLSPLQNRQDIIRHFKEAKIPSCYEGIKRKDLRSRVLARYGSSISIANYTACYKRALECSSVNRHMDEN